MMRFVASILPAALILAGMAGAAAAPPRPAPADPAPAPPIVLVARSELRGVGAADDAPLFDHGVPGPLIRDLQELLQESGDYDGPVDGYPSARLEAAIHHYQRRMRLPVDGRPSAGLLLHLETFLLKARLGTRLEDRVRERKAAVRKALLAQPETRGLVARPAARRADRVADPTRDPSPCLRAPTAFCLLREATESAKPENRAEFRDWAYGEIVAAQAQAGLMAEAFETAARIDDPRGIVVALGRIAEAQAATGDLATALKTTGLVPDPVQRAEALLAIAERHIDGLDRRRAGPVLRALEAAAADLTEPGPRAVVLAGFARVLWRHLDRAAAAAALDQARRLIGEMAAGNAGGDSWVGAIARVLAEMDRPGQALALVDHIADRTHRQAALLAVAKPLAANGHTGRALAAARRISEARYRVVALADIAAAEAGRGAARSARGLLEEALSELPGIELPYARGFAASHAAVAAAAIAGADRAAAIAEGVEDARLRARTLWRIVLAP
ncbi:MAG: peptidoglycan-binding domain-containing protein, partial [Kiloniellales bacterium]